MQRAAQAYFQTGVTTTGQGDILVMLYDAAIKFMNQAKECLEANDMAGKGNNITRTLQILEELSNTLDMAKGGELAVNLRNLYTFCSNRLVMANIRKSTEMIDEVLKIISGLRAAFAAIVDLPEAREAAAQAAAAQRASGILPGRAQPGTTAPTASAPGAGARLRNFYTQNQQQAAAGEAEDASEQLEDAHASPHETQAAAAPAPGAREAAAAPVSLHAEEPPRQEPSIFDEQVPAMDAEAAGPAPAFSPPPTGFGGGKMMGSSLYKKMAQQQ